MILKKAMAIVLAGSVLSASLARGEEEISAESLVEFSSQLAVASTEEGTNPFMLTMAPEAANALLVSGALLITTAGALYGWSKLVYYRKYRMANEQAKLALANGAENPISSFGQNSELSQVADIEKAAFIQANGDPNALTEAQLAQIIIIRAERAIK